MPPNSDPHQLSRALKDEARRVGFDLVGIAPAVTPTGFAALQHWLGQGHHGEMAYMERRGAAYEHPRGVLESVRSLIVLAVNYKTADPPLNMAHPEGKAPHPGSAAETPARGAGETPAFPGIAANQGRVARYAWGTADYHDLLRERLRRLADFLHTQRPGCRTRGVVDTAPLLERDFARLAGLGWFGKNTLLIHKRAGSWLLLAALLTDVELEPDQSHETAHCGTCTRCLDACPTDAFPEPYVLDARRCISYLTIELRGPIPPDLRAGMGDWLFGCDICQDVCPWNRKAPATTEPAFQPLPDLAPADLPALLRMDEEQFRARFRHTPLERPKRAGLLRNACLVLGNRGDAQAVPALIHALSDTEPLIRGAAAWALGQLGGAEAAAALQSRRPVENNADVRAELDAALERIEKN